MNERIRELYDQCFVVLENDTPNTGFDVNKFVELIVRECAEVVQEGRWMVPPSQEQLANSIKKHFRVK